MTVQESVYARLQGLGSVYYLRAPQSEPLPYLIYQMVSGVEEFDFEGSTELTNSRVQVDAYASTPTAADALWRSARTLMEPPGNDFACGAINVVGEFPERSLDENVHRASGDFSLWHDIG